MLVPPAGYIPRHYRGTPLKGDAVAVTLVYTFIILGKGQTGCYRASPLSEGYGGAGGYVFENRCGKSIYYLKEDFCDLCWLRQLDTYPATIVAPLSKGDYGAVPFVPLCWRGDIIHIKKREGST